MSGIDTAAEEQAVNKLGQQIGYGRLMQLAAQEWRKSLIAKGQPAGGEFVYGPCAAMTVPCGCRGIGPCDWCCGSGWITKRVRQAQQEAKSDHGTYGASA